MRKVPLIITAFRSVMPVHNRRDGFDQINIELPLTLRGAGEVDVVIEAVGALSNTARIQII